MLHRDRLHRIGIDGAVFQVLTNTEAGLTAIAAQSGGFQPSNKIDPADVVTPGLNFGNPPPRNADNQTSWSVRRAGWTPPASTLRPRLRLHVFQAHRAADKVCRLRLPADGVWRTPVPEPEIR